MLTADSIEKPTIFTRLFPRAKSSFLLALGLGILSNFCSQATQAAERLAFSYPPFGEFYIRVDDLEILATEGRITDKLAFFTNRLTPEQVETAGSTANE